VRAGDPSLPDSSSSEEFLEPRDFDVGAIHVGGGGGKVSGVEGGVRLGEELPGALHCFKNVAANDEALSLLLVAKLLDS
jgi:hypothetical protein